MDEYCTSIDCPELLRALIEDDYYIMVYDLKDPSQLGVAEQKWLAGLSPGQIARYNSNTVSSFKDALVGSLVGQMRLQNGGVVASAEEANELSGIRIIRQYIDHNWSDLEQRFPSLANKDQVTIEQAHSLMSSRGGKETWRRIKAALRRQKNGEALLPGDQDRIDFYNAFTRWSDERRRIFMAARWSDAQRAEHGQKQRARIQNDSHNFQQLDNHFSNANEVDRLVMEMKQVLKDRSTIEEAISALSNFQAIRDLKDMVKDLHFVTGSHTTYKNAKKDEKFVKQVQEVRLYVVVRPSNLLQTSLDLVTAIGAVLRESSSSLLSSKKGEFIRETILNILKPHPAGQQASMVGNDALRTAITEYNQGEKSLADFRVFLVKKNKTFAASEHAGFKVFNLFTESNKKVGLASKLQSIARHQILKNLQILGFQSVRLEDAKNLIGH
jgi:hypothetical protein